MNRSTILIVAFGFGFALLAALAVQLIGGHKKAPDTAEAAKTIAVLVAAKDIKAGDKLEAGSTQWVTWPDTTQFEGAITREGDQKAEDALTGRVRRAIAKGEPMMASAIIEDTKANFVAASLTPGKRAVTITVNAQSSVAGFVNPGDHVDVLLTYDVKMPSDEKVRKAAMPVVTKYASETILENLRVLAIDQDTGKKTEAKVGKTVTLEVGAQEAEAVALAARMGSLSLALRSLGDDTPTRPEGNKTAPATTDLRLSRVMSEIMSGENKSGSLTRVVRIYSGARVDNVEVRPYVSQ